MTTNMNTVGPCLPPQADRSSVAQGDLLAPAPRSTPTGNAAVPGGAARSLAAEGSLALSRGTLLTRRATIGPRTLDATARTCEAIVATAEPVRRRGPSPSGDPGDWIEVLDIAGCELPAGAPVLRGHDFNNPDALIGVVESSRVEGGELIARLQFSSRPAVDELLRDLSAGIGAAGISIGYEVSQWQRR